MTVGAIALRFVLAGLFVIAWMTALPARAATYNYRSDSFAWETAANVVNWDKSCTGYPGDDDKATLNFSGGFTFTFAGTAYSSVRVLSNGMLQFGADNGFFRSYGNTSLPADPGGSYSGCVAGPTTKVLMAYWTDLNPVQTGSGRVYWEQKGTAPNRRLIVSWDSVYQYGTSTPYAVQVILFENGEFKYQYGNANASGSSATIGVQVDSSDYTLYSYNSGYNANGSAIRWFIPSGAADRVAEYRFDEFSYAARIGEVLDSSGHGNHGVGMAPSATTVADGKVCRALDVPANTSNASAGADSLLNISAGVGNAGSLSFFYRSDLAWSSNTPAMLMDASNQANRPFYLQRDGGGALRFVVSDSNGTTLSTSGSQLLSPSANSWVHITATWNLNPGSNQSTLRLYINGVLQATKIGTTTGMLSGAIGALMIGDNRAAAAPSGGTLNSARGSIDELRIYNYEISIFDILSDVFARHDCPLPIDHLELRHASGTGLTCTPSTVTVVACQDAACSAEYSGGVSGNLSSSGGTVLWPAGNALNIPSGTSRVDVSLQLVTAGSTLLDTQASSPAVPNATRCNFGNPSCTFTAADAGFILSLPHHYTYNWTGGSLRAVRKSDASNACTPAFANVDRNLNFTCTALDPTPANNPGMMSLRKSSSSPATFLNTSNTNAACDATGATVSLRFDANGQAALQALEALPGKYSLAATYTGSSGSGDAGLVMKGSNTFIAAPAQLVLDTAPSNPVAGSPMTLKLRALNAGGFSQASYGLEATPQMPVFVFKRASPTGTGAVDGSFSGTPTPTAGGYVTVSDLSWSEVGTFDLTATIQNYLGSGLSTTYTSGVAGAFGPVKPHHFDVSTTAACGTFSYAGQPFPVTITARNALGASTLNYDGSASTSPNFARAHTLSAASAIAAGAWSGNPIAASNFLAGAANISAAYSFSSKLSAPQSLGVRTTDADGVSSAAGTEGTQALRSGRLRLFNAYGRSGVALSISAQAEYWSGKAWLLNDKDGCSALPAASFARYDAVDTRGASASLNTSLSALSLSGGSGTLTASAPASPGSLLIAPNLGAASTAKACVASAGTPSASGAALPWLRSQFGTPSADSAVCPGGAWGSDPSARISFGIFSPESQRTIRVNEIH